MTEIVEFVLNLAEKGKPDNSDGSQRSAGFSFTGLFGGTQKTADSAPASNNPPGQNSSQDHHARVAAVSNAVIPLKLKFAMMLADFGLTKESAEYAVFLKKVTCKINNRQHKLLLSFLFSHSERCRPEQVEERGASRF